MSIAYCTAEEVKRMVPDAFGGGSSYDNALKHNCDRASRLIDQLTNRQFWPETATRYYDGNGTVDLWIDDLLAVTSVNISEDQGATWTAMDTTDYLALGGENLRYDATPYALLRIDAYNGDYGSWYLGPRTAKVVGIWGWHDNYTAAWENSQDTVEDASGMLANATTITINDRDGADLQGMTPRFQAGQLLKIDNEQFIVRAAVTNTLTVAGAQHGTTAATHAKGSVIYIWRPADIIRQAATVQAVRWFKRGQQGFQDTGAVAELGQITYTQKLDPDIATMLMHVRRGGH
ncbi:MAG: hypothetical protein BWX54_01141 [Verrucomicrobia bacterium ADurb.Bin018]|nr:MAG: hypothetical protein BWX54_01141 [Verrucomicrobia bacterium ADurb.Bin018]